MQYSCTNVDTPAVETSFCSPLIRRSIRKPLSTFHVDISWRATVARSIPSVSGELVPLLLTEPNERKEQRKKERKRASQSERVARRYSTSGYLIRLLQSYLTNPRAGNRTNSCNCIAERALYFHDVRSKSTDRPVG